MRILEAVADRAAVAQESRDLMEVIAPVSYRCGITGPTWRSSLNLWWHTLIELWAWTKTHGQLCDRRDRPWDRADRRPSHADRRNALRRLCVQTTIRQAGRRRHLSRKLHVLCRYLLKLAAWG